MCINFGRIERQLVEFDKYFYAEEVIGIIDIILFALRHDIWSSLRGKELF